MRRSIKIALVILMLALCAGMLALCAGDEAQSAGKAPFEWVYSSAVAIYRVGYDPDTGVMYSMSNGGYNSGTLTLLVNADGSPKVWEGYNAPRSGFDGRDAR